MRIVNMKQHTPEWLQWRAEGIGASDAAIILGLSPYKTPWRLWKEKMGKLPAADLSNNYLVNRGNAKEDSARQLAEKLLGEDFLLPVCAESDANPLIRASFDGLTKENIPVELKVPHPSTYEEVKALGTSSNAFGLYYPQVQLQIYVAEADQGFLLFYNPEEDDCELFPIQRNDEFIADMIDSIEMFLESMKEGKEPEMNPERDIFMSDQQELWFAAENIKITDIEIKTLEAKLKQLKDTRSKAQKLIEDAMGKFSKAEINGVSLTRFWREGTIDYKLAVQELCPTIDQTTLETYRKEGSLQIKLTIKKENQKKAA